MGQCSSDAVAGRWEVCSGTAQLRQRDRKDVDTEPRAISLERIRSLSSNTIVPAAHMSEIQEGRKLCEDFDITGEVLGHGLSGDVVMAYSKLDKGRFAMKTISKDRVGGRLAQLTSEVEVYITLSHPNIAKLEAIYEGGSRVCLLMECCTGGELYTRLQERGVYLPSDAAEASRQMLQAVGYLHSRNVVHRDIKLENFLYASEAQDAQLKLIDFGFAKVWEDPSKLMLSPCGSVSYVSPDVLSGTGYTNKCDMWSLGIVVWMLLSGYPPFHGEDAAIMQKIKACEPDWSHKSRWKSVPDDAINLVRKLLDKDPLCRPSAVEASQHPWLALPAEAASEAALGQPEEGLGAADCSAADSAAAECTAAACAAADCVAADCAAADCAAGVPAPSSGSPKKSRHSLGGS